MKSEADAAAAGALAAQIAAREVAPHVADWDRTEIPADAAQPFRAAGLLEDDLGADVAVAVARAVGREGLAVAVHVLGIDPSAAVPDLRLAAALVAAGEALLDSGIAYAREREVFGRPLAKFQVQRHAFAGVSADLAAALALTTRVAERDAPDRDPVELAAVVSVAADAAWRAAETALQVHGGYGYTDDYPVSRMWREVAAVRAEIPLAAFDAELEGAAMARAET